MGGKMTLYRECCFSNCTKSWWTKSLSKALGGDHLNRHHPGSAPVSAFNVNVVGDGYPVHQPCDTNVTAVEIKLTEMQENRALKNVIQCYSLSLISRNR